MVISYETEVKFALPIVAGTNRKADGTNNERIYNFYIYILTF